MVKVNNEQLLINKLYESFDISNFSAFMSNILPGWQNGGLK